MKAKAKESVTACNKSVKKESLGKRKKREEMSAEKAAK